MEADIDIYYLNSEKYESISTHYQSSYNGINIDRSHKITIRLGIPNNHTTEDLWLSKDEYIEKRNYLKYGGN